MYYNLVYGQLVFYGFLNASKQHLFSDSATIVTHGHLYIQLFSKLTFDQYLLFAVWESKQYFYTLLKASKTNYTFVDNSFHIHHKLFSIYKDQINT